MKNPIKRRKGIILAAGVLGMAALAGCEGFGDSNADDNPGGGQVFQQVDRLSRPVVNEVFATVANNPHKTNNEISPKQDQSQLANDIRTFMTGVAGRSNEITNVVVAVLTTSVPAGTSPGDVMKANLNAPGPTPR